MVDENSPRIPQAIVDSDLPMLGICYGQQALTQQLGGKVEKGDSGEFGEAFITVEGDCTLFDGLWKTGERHQVWMSHGDKVTALAPGFQVVATSPGAPYAIIANEERRIYAMQFHPEVVHTPDGAKLIANFVRQSPGLSGDWTMAEFRAAKIAEIREQVGTGKVICGLSGGVDSSVAALLIHEAIGDQLTCVFVDGGNPAPGRGRAGRQPVRGHYNIRSSMWMRRTCSWTVWRAVTDPEAKRKFIGKTFIDVFEPRPRRSAGRVPGPGHALP